MTGIHCIMQILQYMNQSILHLKMSLCVRGFYTKILKYVQMRRPYRQVKRVNVVNCYKDVKIP